MTTKVPKTKVRITLTFEVPASKATEFHKDLIKRMHQYLAKRASKVIAVDSEIL